MLLGQVSDTVPAARTVVSGLVKILDGFFDMMEEGFAGTDDSRKQDGLNTILVDFE
jgi:hypothetical protein